MKVAGLKTFGELVMAFYDTVSRRFNKNCSRVHVVVDVYKELTIKCDERARRSQQGAIELKVIRTNTPMPRQWDKFMTSSNNKTCLLQFMVEELQTIAANTLPVNRTLILGGFADGTYVVVNKSRSENIPSLATSHEEADTRIIFHLQQIASAGISCVLVESPDTDVFLLLVHFYDSLGIPEINFLTGTADKRSIPIHRVARSLGDLVPFVLPLHALTGCDTVSAFRTIGKVRPWNAVKANPSRYLGIQALGSVIDLADDTLSACSSLISACYGSKAAVSPGLVEMRYRLFCRKGFSDKLPPTPDTFECHVKRANYQTLIWKMALEKEQDVPSPIGNGWLTSEDGNIVPEYTRKDSAPKDILELIMCHCKSACTKRCRFVQNNLPCTDACGCVDIDCANKKTHNVEQTSDDEDDDENDGSDEEEFAP